MSLDMVKAYIEGYEDHLIDYQILAVQSGYWSSYYVGAKHPKPWNVIAEEIHRAHVRAKDKSDVTKVKVPRPDVDVEGFLAQEARFKARMSQT